MILNDEDQANDTKAHNEDAFTAQREKSKLQNRRGNNENRNKSFQGKCYHCQQKGHFAKNCPKKTKNESTVRPVKQEVVLLVVQNKNVQLMMKKKH